MAEQQADPTPEEIRERCQVIRSSWDLVTEIRRRAHTPAPIQPCTVREYAFEISREGKVYLRQIN